MRAVLVCSLCGLALFAFACSLVTSTDGLVGAPNDAGADQRADAPNADAPLDSPADVSPADVVDEAPVAFCASLLPTPALCEDFDGPNRFDALFSQTAQGAANEIGSDGAYFASPPRSFFSRFAAGIPQNKSYAFMYATFAQTATRVTFGFDILIAQAVSGKYAVATGIVIKPGSPAEHRLELLASGVDGSAQESFATDAGIHYQSKALSAFPMLGRWARVKMVVALTQRTMTVTVDGATALGAAPLDPGWPTSGDVQVNLGMTYVSDTSGAWLVRYDNVFVYVE